MDQARCHVKKEFKATLEENGFEIILTPTGLTGLTIELTKLKILK